MVSYEIPFTSQEVDTDDGAMSVVMTLALVVVGFATFAWAQDVGGVVANQVNSAITGVVGVDPTSGQDSGADGV